MKNPLLWAAALLILLCATSCQAFARGVTTAANQGADMLNVVAIAGTGQEHLRQQLEDGEIPLELYLASSRELSATAAREVKARGSALFSELGEIAKSVKTEGVGNLPAAAGAFVGGVTQGQDTISAGMAALLALLGIGGPVVGTVAYGRSQTRRDERLLLQAEVKAQAQAKVAMLRLDAERNEKYIVRPTAPTPVA